MAGILIKILVNNQYKDIITPLVEKLGIGQAKVANPHEAWLAMKLLNLRTVYWGGDNIPSGTIDNDDVPAEFELLTPASAIEFAVRAARADRASTPNTTLIQDLVKKLDSISMNQPNAFQDWNKAVDYFKSQVSFLDYFTRTYKNGKYKDYYEKELGIYRHPDSNFKGLSFANLTGGLDGVVSVFANTVIYTGASQFADDTGTSPYFTLNAFGVALPYQFYFSQNDADVPAVIAGGTFADIEIAITGTETAAQMRDLIYAAIDGTSAFTVTTDGNNVIATATGPGTTIGEFNYTNLAMFPDVSKLYDFTADGPAVGGSIFSFALYFDKVDEGLANRFFILSDLADQTTLLYYDLDGAGTFITPPPAAPDNTVAIPITTGMTASDIQSATKTVIDGLGYITTSVNGLELSCTYNTAGDPDQVDPGNSKIGINYVYNSELRAPGDDALLASDIYSDEDYAYKWNNLVVPYERAAQRKANFLNPNILTEGAKIGGGLEHADGPGFSTDCTCCWPGVPDCTRGEIYYNTVLGDTRCFCSIGAGVLMGSGGATAQWFPTDKGPYNTPGNIPPSSTS